MNSISRGYVLRLSLSRYDSRALVKTVVGSIFSYRERETPADTDQGAEKHDRADRKHCDDDLQDPL